MTALIKYTDALLVQSNKTWDGEGQNYRDNRSAWFNKADPSVDISATSFVMPDGTTHVNATNWTIDSGPVGLDVSLLEDRAFCTKGLLRFSFTGTTLVMRLNIDFGWGTGHTVLIDGVAPLSIAGVLGGTNTLSCDAETYGLGGAGYIDVLVADGLPNTAHTVNIYVNKGASGFFSFVGYKVYGFASRDLLVDGLWVAAASLKLPQNQSTLSLINNGSNAVQAASLTYPAGLVDNNNAALAPTAAATMNGGARLTQPVMPGFVGTEETGTFRYPIALSALYLDPTGTVIQNSTSTLVPGSPGLTVTGTWFTDSTTPNGQPRLFTNKTGTSANQLSFTFVGDALTLTVEQNFGYGILGIYDDAGTLLNSVTCNAQADTVFTTTLTGFGAGSHSVHLHKTTTDTSKYVIFMSASWQGQTTFSQIDETVNLVIQAQQPLAMPVQNVQQGPYALTFDPPDPTAKDLTDAVVRLNTNIAYTEVLQRFPTYAVCYNAGYGDILDQYDILIVDPFAAKTADVLRWQSMGIKVFGYISMGEEDGFFSNRYDLNSAAGPFVGDAGGPGGYASYYMKGGYQARECTECQNDNQALGTKTCAQSRAEYFQGTGRCSGACSKDSLNGYLAFSTGGQCAGGFTSANNWQRPDANTACTNASCPKYTPIHSIQTGTKCPKYEIADAAYLQDFSISSPNTPDQNGIWGSYYADSGKAAWHDRIMSYYAPAVLGGEVVVSNETVTVKSATIPSGTVMVFDTAQFPIDPDAPITVTSADGTVVYTTASDLSYDMKTGAFIFNNGLDTPPTVGENLIVSYTKKGHRMDGIFMDTIDDADVYPQMGSLISALINNLKVTTGTKLISNRGFSNLDAYIQSCAGVMFESWLTDWDENTGQYFKINDPDSLSFNDGVNAQLSRLRGTHVFDVYSLNYCNADSSGDPLRLYCTQEDRKKGYLSWTSTIDLDVPAPNRETATPGLKVTSSVFQQFRKKNNGG